MYLVGTVQVRIDVSNRFFHMSSYSVPNPLSGRKSTVNDSTTIVSPFTSDLSIVAYPDCTIICSS